VIAAHVAAKAQFHYGQPRPADAREYSGFRVIPQKVKHVPEKDCRGGSMDARVLIEEIVRKSAITCSENTLLSEIDGWDSLKGVRLVLRIEEMVGRQLTEDDIEQLQRVADVERLLRSGA
jgi:acyl carrier protein